MAHSRKTATAQRLNSSSAPSEAAKQLAVQLRAGALPANLAVVEERVVPVGR